MAKKYLDYDGLLYFWQKIKATFVTDVTYNSTSKKIQKTKAGSASDVVTLSTVATSGSYNDLSNKPTIPSGVEKTTTTPLMDGTAAIGSETKFAAGDHVHPTDTSRASADDLDDLAGVVDDLTDTVDGKADKSATVSNVQWTSSGNKITKTINGTTSDVVSATQIKNAIGGASSTSSGLMTASEWSKLHGIAEGAEVNVQSDWDQSTTTADDYIKNKPTIPSAGTGSSYPAMDGTRSLGSDAGYARVDHVHPSDTSRVPTTRTVNGKALSRDVTIGADDIDVTVGVSVADKFDSVDTALSNKIPNSQKGTALGVCPLDANGKVDSSFLPSYVDDVIEAYPRSGQTELSQNWLAIGSASGTVITPEAGKIYILMADSTSYAANSQFRWGGTTYVKMNDGGVSSITNAEIDTIVAS